jgi:uncharacterized protein YdcH (DUF465 family)
MLNWALTKKIISLSLAEIDKGVRDTWPYLFSEKPAIMRAYKEADKSGDGFVDEKEFSELLYFLAYYDELFDKFEDMDTDRDQRVTYDEFVKGHEIAGLKVPQAQLKQEFASIDEDGGGMIRFVEFCHYMAKKRVGKDSTLKSLISRNKEAVVASTEKPNRTFRNSVGPKILKPIVSTEPPVTAFQDSVIVRRNFGILGRAQMPRMDWPKKLVPGMVLSSNHVIEFCRRYNAVNCNDVYVVYPVFLVLKCLETAGIRLTARSDVHQDS